MGLTYKNILMAVDGSQEAEWAFKKAIEISKRNNAKLTLVHVIDTRTFVAIEAYDGTMTERARKYAEDLLTKYQTDAEEAGVSEVSTIIEYGSPKVVIPRNVAKEMGADLIVCGATGLNAVERLLIGSVSENITRSAKCDVLVVRTEKEQ